MILNAFLALYRLAWVILTPLVVIYLWWRGRRDQVYRAHLGERFGSHATLPQDAVWIHAVSLGEVRSAVPLARDLLDAGESIVFTHFTPAGRREAQGVFADEIKAGRVASVWVPLDMFWVFTRFFRAFRPKIGLVMEIEIWPAMVFAARRAGVSLYMCNAQYPDRSLSRDSKGLRLRQRIMTGFAGAFVKSQLQADRFASVGVQNIHITGELRFDQPIPESLLTAATAFSKTLNGRPVVTISSAVEGEDDVYIEAMKALLADEITPLFVYVPRAPERFDRLATMLSHAGFNVARRTQIFDDMLNLRTGWPDDVDVLLGDSMGEMYFYLSLADKVVAGGGFTPRGAHNIIEPLALEKPVVTGPYTHTIENPFVEAEAAGVAKSTPDAAALIDALRDDPWATPDQIKVFMTTHRGASAKTVSAIQTELGRATG